MTSVECTAKLNNLLVPEEFAGRDEEWRSISTWVSLEDAKSQSAIWSANDMATVFFAAKAVDY